MSRFTSDPNYLLDLAIGRVSEIADSDSGVGVHESTHPIYDRLSPDWEKWRLAYRADADFKEEFLEQFSLREKVDAFLKRKKMTYVTPHAQVAINECKDAIFQRLVNVNRWGGTESYQAAVQGDRGGVDLQGSTMNGFIGNEILPELLPLGKSGIYVDSPAEFGSTIAESGLGHPYLYTYAPEDIRNWVWQSTGDIRQLKAIILRDIVHTYDQITGLPIGTEAQFRMMWIVEGAVAAQLFNDEGEPIGMPKIIDLPEIPFVFCELQPTSLMNNVADYQIALMNLESADLQYALSGNIPLYTEQFNPLIESPFLREATGNDGSDPEADTDDPGEAADAATSKRTGIEMGVGVARKYPKDLDRPGFVHPSSEPLKASMEKGDKIKADIRLNVKLAVQNLSPRSESAESKGMDERSLEAGLSAIGLILEQAERKIAVHWARYENSSERATVHYPRRWDFKTQKERQSESENLLDAIDTTPSLKFKKAALKRVAENTLEDIVSVSLLEEIKQEIDDAKIIVGDSERIKEDIENGILSLDSAADFRVYPSGEVEQAAKDHTERVKRIAESQASSRGTPELAGLADAPEDEKDGDVTGAD